MAPSSVDATRGGLCVSARGVTKVFPGVVAVADVDLHVGRGEIVALVGENGAGKSTLMKLLAGVYPPTQGSIERGPGVRVALVHQELCLADNLTAGQNVCLGREPARWGFIQERALHERSNVALRRLGADFGARTPVADLSLAQRQLVEIAKALDEKADVLILDEPTSSLTQASSDRLLETVAGLRPAHSGSIRLEGADITGLTVRGRIDAGMGFVPEDRAGCGLFTGGRVDENLTLPSAHTRAKGSPWPPGGWLRRAAEAAEYHARAGRLDVRAASPRMAVDSLSGGNHQKILVGRWIHQGLLLLVLDEPTRGVDVGAREGIYHVVEGLARRGAGVLFASSDLEEVRRLAHRIVVMRDGRMVGELAQGEATEAAVMNLATGLETGAAPAEPTAQVASR